MENGISIIEKIKTFDEACAYLGESNPLVRQYRFFEEGDTRFTEKTDDLEAYLKLRIICAALNEGNEPKFTNEEERYGVRFWISDIDVTENKDNILLSDKENGSNLCIGVRCVKFKNVPLASSLQMSRRLCFNDSDLAYYCGKQFKELWKDYLLGGSWEIKEKS